VCDGGIAFRLFFLYLVPATIYPSKVTSGAVNTYPIIPTASQQPKPKRIISARVDRFIITLPAMSAVFHSPLADIPLPPPQSIFNYYLPAKSRYPDYAALTDGASGRSITVAQLRNTSLRLGLGIQRVLKLSAAQQTVAVIYSPNSIDFAQIFYGCQAVKVVTSLANASYTASELAHQLRDGDPSIVFVHPAIYDAYLGAIKLLETEGRSLPRLFWAVPENEVPQELLGSATGVKSYQALLVDEEAVEGFNGIPAHGEEAHETAMLCYSSGTVSRFQLGHPLFRFESLTEMWLPS
jgi:hypothetical protein